MKTPQTTEDEEKEEAAAHLDSREHGAFARSPQLIIEHTREVQTVRVCVNRHRGVESVFI